MEQVTRLHLTKEDKQLRNYTIWKTIYRQLVEVHLQFSKSLSESAVFAESAFRTDSETSTSGIMTDMGQILVNELKSESKLIKDQWEGYNKDKSPFDLLSLVDGKNNRTIQKEVNDACTDRSILEHKVKHAQKKFFRSFDQTRALIEKIQSEDSDSFLKDEMKSELFSLKSKTDVHLAKYRSTYQNEYDNRKDFIQKMTEIQNKWMQKEKEYLETWVKSCQDLCCRMDKTVPRIFTNPLNNNSPYPAIIKKFTNLDINELVTNSLYRKLEKHHFPIYKERRMEDIITPPGSTTHVNKDIYVPDPELMESFIANTLQQIKEMPSEETILQTQDRRHVRHSKVQQHKNSSQYLEMVVPIEEYVCAEQNINKNKDSVEIFKLSESNSSDSDSELEIINLNDPNNIESTANKISYEGPLPQTKVNLWYYEDNIEEQRFGLHGCKKSPEIIICNMKNVYVSVIKEYTKRSREEIHLKLGMQIKQKQCANDKGMAYGWYKKKKMGVKKYGYYPVDHVILLQRSSWSSHKFEA